MSDSNRPFCSERTLTSFIASNDPLGLFSASDCDVLGNAIQDTLMPLTFPPLEELPCANNCPYPAKLPCDRCRLVSYCSRKCERNHRSIHKKSCNVASVSSACPVAGSWGGNQCHSGPPPVDEGSMPMTTPLSRSLLALDIINLKNNEQDKTRDFFLTFLASRDLRNIIRTVNALGSDYTGSLRIVLNDTSKTTVSRIIVLLLILGAMPNEAVAADIALHFWCSTFLPEEYRLRIIASLALILQKHTDQAELLSVNLGRRARLTCLVPLEITDNLLYTAGPTLSTLRARDEYERASAMPARLDARNRALAGVKPCHSLAFLAFWRSGVVLPFSVDSDRYIAPNASLFSPSHGTWIGNDVENMLACWDPNEVIKSGQAHGAQPEDIYGCLYFFLSDQLRQFAKRIRELDVTFYVFNAAPHVLAQGILDGQYSQYGLTPSIRFDRIDLGHALTDSACMQDLLVLWTPLLARGETAVIIGVFSDWTYVQKDGSAAGSDEAVVAPIVEKLIQLGRLPHEMTPKDAMVMEAAQLDAAYDNSKPFSRFLKTIGLGDILRSTSLKRRLRHKVVAQRIRMPIDAKVSDLPQLPDDESWYRYTRLAKIAFTTRYIELVRTSA